MTKTEATKRLTWLLDVQLELLMAEEIRAPWFQTVSVEDRSAALRLARAMGEEIKALELVVNGKDRQ